ncbi:MAG: ABC transporter permease, partial [Opitutaceae bacterium]
MSDNADQPQAHVTVQPGLEGCKVILAGVWRITATPPRWADYVGEQKPDRLKVEMQAVQRWDSSLLLFLFEVQQWCRAHETQCDLEAVPAKVRTLLGQLVASHETSVPFDRSENFLTSVGLATQDAWKKVREIIAFVGECVISAWRLVRLPHKFRWRDCVDEMQQCGAMALPIVSLISFLVGLIMAYQAAVQLRQFGAD